MIEIDMTPLVRYRAAQKDAFQRREGFALSYVPFFIEATIEALKEFPILNASWSDGGIAAEAGDQHRHRRRAGEQQGLIVPVIKGADSAQPRSAWPARSTTWRRARARATG